MKYITATLACIAIIFLFAVFAVSVGLNGRNIIIQSALWTIVATVWVTIVNKWNTIVARVRRGSTKDGQTPVLTEQARYTILIGTILIVGIGLIVSFANMNRNRAEIITAAEFIARYRADNPSAARGMSDADLLYTLLTQYPQFKITESSK